jgi:hypothetical protein
MTSASAGVSFWVAIRYWLVRIETSSGSGNDGAASLRVKKMSVQRSRANDSRNLVTEFASSPRARTFVLFERAGLFGTANQGIFGANVENACIAAFPDLYIPLRLGTAVFSRVEKALSPGAQRVPIKIFREG